MNVPGSGSTRPFQRNTLLPMATGKRCRRARQPSMWIDSADPLCGASHPLYGHLFRRDLARERYLARPAGSGTRPLRLLLHGCFDGLHSYRAIAPWAADSLSLRRPLEAMLHEAPRNHSTTVSSTRHRTDVEQHRGLLRGATEAGRGRLCPGARRPASTRQRLKPIPRCKVSSARTTGESHKRRFCAAPCLADDSRLTLN